MAAASPVRRPSQDGRGIPMCAAAWGEAREGFVGERVCVEESRRACVCERGERKIKTEKGKYKCSERTTAARFNRKERARAHHARPGSAQAQIRFRKI